MTSTTDIHRDVDDLSEEVLGNLSPDERARLGVRLRAAGKAELLRTLRNTAPTKTYEVSPELDFLEEEHRLRAEALYALWELETGVWRFFYERAMGQLREANYHRFPDEDWTETPTPENGFHEEDAQIEAVMFLADYRAWERYATEHIGVSLREFLLHALKPEAGAAHVDRIEFVAELADGRYPDGDVGGLATDASFMETEEDIVEHLTGEKYREIVSGVQEER